MKYIYTHPANFGFSPNGIYSRSEIEAVLKGRTDELINVLFTEEKKEVKTAKKGKVKVDKKDTFVKRNK